MTPGQRAYGRPGDSEERYGSSAVGLSTHFGTMSYLRRYTMVTADTTQYNKSDASKPAH